MLVIKSTISFPNGIWAKSRKYVGPRCSPTPSAVKSNLLVMLVNTSANNLVEFTDVNILFFILLSLLLVQLPSRWYYTIFMWFVLRPHYLLYTYLSLIPAFFLFSIKLCESLSTLSIMISKQMKVLYFL